MTASTGLHQLEFIARRSEILAGEAAEGGDNATEVDPMTIARRVIAVAGYSGAVRLIGPGHIARVDFWSDGPSLVLHGHGADDRPSAGSVHLGRLGALAALVRLAGVGPVPPVADDQQPWLVGDPFPGGLEQLAEGIVSGRLRLGEDRELCTITARGPGGAVQRLALIGGAEVCWTTEVGADPLHLTPGRVAQLWAELSSVLGLAPEGQRGSAPHSE